MYGQNREPGKHQSHATRVCSCWVGVEINKVCGMDSVLFKSEKC